MKRALLLPLLLALPLSAMAQAKVYRWVDAQGQVHYSQTPPPEIGAQAHSVRTVPASAAPAPSPSPPAATKPATPAAQAAAVDPNVERAERAKRCTEARDRVTYLEEKTARRLGVEQPDGSLARMTEEEFEDRLGKARGEVTRNCGS